MRYILLASFLVMMTVICVRCHLLTSAQDKLVLFFSSLLLVSTT